MNLVDKENRSVAALTIKARLGNRAAEFFYARKDRGQRDEARVGLIGKQTRQSSLPGTRRTPKDQRRHRRAALDQATQYPAFADELFLTDEL
jgi:hypothetical protein